jgi:hypothetical protein
MLLRAGGAVFFHGAQRLHTVARLQSFEKRPIAALTSILVRFRWGLKGA